MRLGVEVATSEERSTESRILDALRPLLGPRRISGVSRTPPPYLRRHALEHAVAGGVLDSLLQNDEFLPFADASRIRQVLRGDSLSDPALVWRAAAHRWSWENPRQNATALSLWAQGLGRPHDYPSSAWASVWTPWRQGHSEILALLESDPSGLAASVLPDGRAIVVICCWDGTVRVLDLADGSSIGDPATAFWKPSSKPSESVTAVATISLHDGRAVAVAGGEKGQVGLWDLTRQIPVGDAQLGHGRQVTAVATATCPGGFLVAVTGSEDGTVKRPGSDGGSQSSEG